MIRSILAGIVSCSVLLGGGMTTTAHADEVSRITLTQAGEGFWWMAQYVAEAAGIYKEVGLEVDVVYVPSGSRQIAAVLGGSAIATTVNLESGIMANDSGGDIVTVGGTFSQFPMSLVLSNSALESTGISPDMPMDEKIKRLNGLKIAISSPGSGTDKFLRAMFEVRGLNPDREVSIQPIGNGASQLAALESGLVDGIIWTSPIVEVAETRGVGKVVIDALSGEAPEYTISPYIAILTSKQAIENQREDLQKLVTAFALALKFIDENPEKTREFVKAKFPDIDDVAFDKGFANNQPAVSKTPFISPEQYEATLASIKSRGNASLDVPFEKMVDNSFAEHAAEWIAKNGK